MVVWCWPVVGLALLTLLGLAVGKGSTALDDWFQVAGAAHPGVGRLLVFTDGRVTLTLWALVLVVAALRRQWRLAAVAAVMPLVATSPGIAAAPIPPTVAPISADGTSPSIGARPAHVSGNWPPMFFPIRPSRPMFNPS